MFSQAFSLAVWESLFPACVVRGRANLLLSFHSAAPIPLQSLSVFSLLLAVAGQQEEAPSLFHISSPLKYPLDVVLPFSYIRGRFVYCPLLLVQFNNPARRYLVCSVVSLHGIVHLLVHRSPLPGTDFFWQVNSCRIMSKPSVLHGGSLLKPP